PSGSAWAASPWCRAEAGKRCLRVRMSKGGAVTQRRRAPVEPCRKVLGADFELANALEGAGVPQGQSVWEAARRLLDELPGFPRTRRWGGTSIEWGRRFLAGNGGSAYVDSDHLEVNLPEHTRAADHAAQVHAGFRLARAAQERAQAKLPRGVRLNV